MRSHIVFRIIMALVLVAAVAGLMALAYGTGISQGAAQAAHLGAPANPGQLSPAPYPYYPWFFAPFGAFIVVKFIIDFFLFMLVLRLIGGLFWFGHFGGMHRMGMGYHHGGYGPWGMHAAAGDPADPSSAVPPMFAEWHRRAHEAQAAKPPEEPKTQA